MVEELLALSTPEDRLSFLMERPHLHSKLEPYNRTEARKVPGCLSGLWLKADNCDGTCSFSAYSESDLVHGVVSFICDLYSNRSTAEVAEIGGALVEPLKLDGLLSTTRKRAVHSTLAFIQHSIRIEADIALCATANAA
jgi:sulfur transfer protein SufE